ncbi:nucleotidyltransferase family protein [Floccifex sp.]|uniref:nucleotidyltransferase family protein n=1 Tax=Floccifex sp. TaxID=2815810 RepID=UPI003EFC057A
MKTSLIILASGFSSRFHSNKLLHKINDKTLFEITYERRKFFDEVIVVTQYEQIKEFAQEAKVIMNDHPEYGQGYSISLGIQKCDSDYCMLMVSDMPYIKDETIVKMLEIKDEQHVVIGCYQDILCNPMLIPKKYYSYLTNLKNDKGAKQVIAKLPYRIVNLSEQEFIDIDVK